MRPATVALLDRRCDCPRYFEDYETNTGMIETGGASNGSRNKGFNCRVTADALYYEASFKGRELAQFGGARAQF